MRIAIRAGRWWTLTVAVAAGIYSCARNPVTGKNELSLVSESQEIAMGQEYAQQIVKSMGVYRDQKVQDYVSGLGLALAAKSERPNLPWAFYVMDDPTVNAFALPGGSIFVTRGIMSHMNNEAELVGVLGHEIGHVTARHSVQQMTRQQLAQIGLVAGSISRPTWRSTPDSRVRDWGSCSSSMAGMRRANPISSASSTWCGTDTTRGRWPPCSRRSSG